jgi:hypothetical protein
MKELTDGLYTSIEDLYNTLEAEKEALENEIGMLSAFKRLNIEGTTLDVQKKIVKKQRATVRKLQKWYDITQNYAVIDG